MIIFDPQTFRRFLGQPIHYEDHEWGSEQRYLVSETSLTKFKKLLIDTLYYHHSSFDLADEITDIGYPLAAQAMRQRNSGNPTDPKTQMCNLGEVIGAEFAKTFLGFKTTQTFLKRLNPNVDQSMKGVDILGLRDSSCPAELLIGEAKSSEQFNKDSIEQAYDHLVDLHTKEAARMLRSMKESLLLKEDRGGIANVDRHMADGVPRYSFLLSITQSTPEAPFKIITERFKQVQVPKLVAVHIQIQNIKGKKLKGELNKEDAWISKLFAS
jgi:hypothetical protein